MQRIQISHVTEYVFCKEVTLLPHRLLLRPRENHSVRIESSVLDIGPDAVLQWKRDVLDNSVAVARFVSPSDRLRIASGVVIQHYDDNPFDFLLDDYAVEHPFDYSELDRIELEPFLRPLADADREAVRRWLDGLGLAQPMPTIVLLNRLNQAISGEFGYSMREEPGVQSPAETMALNRGSCRDFAALFMAACRFMGLASRFVSGYLHTPGLDVGSQSTHAWAEVYLPGAGWKGFDPTSGVVTSNQHIGVAVTGNPEAVPPVAGSYLGELDTPPQLNVTVQVSVLARADDGVHP